MMCDFSLNGEQILGLRYPSSEPRSIRAPTAHPTNFEYMKAALCGNKKLTIPQVHLNGCLVDALLPQEIPRGVGTIDLEALGGATVLLGQPDVVKHGPDVEQLGIEL
jgi:hypothetical protein